VKRVVRAVVISALMLVVAACQVDVTVDLDVAADGGGMVAVQAAFDADANSSLGGIADQLRTGDAGRAGWDISTIDADDGDVVVTATKTVPDRDQWQAALDEIVGPGVFNNVAVTTDDSFAKARQTLELELDTSQGWDLFSDNGVAAALGGEQFGAPVESLTNGRTIDDIVAVQITITLVSDPDGSAAPATGRFVHRFDSEESLQIRLGSTAEDSTAMLLRWVALALFSLFVLATVLAITGVVLQRRSDRLRPAPTPASLASRVPGAAAAGTDASASTAADPRAKGGDSVRLVVVEPLSVLYKQSRPFDAYVLPFVREHRGVARADTILDGYRSVVSGATDTEAFWQLCDIDVDPATLDDAFVALRRLRSGAAAFLNEMQERRVPVAATTNDASAWSHAMRDRDRLRSVWPWLVSAEVRTTTSNVAMFEVLRRESGVAHRHCLYVDTNLDSLDAAKELGMKTALFDTGDLDLPEMIGHLVITDFKALFSSK